MREKEDSVDSKPGAPAADEIVGRSLAFQQVLGHDRLGRQFPRDPAGTILPNDSRRGDPVPARRVKSSNSSVQLSMSANSGETILLELFNEAGNSIQRFPRYDPELAWSARPDGLIGFLNQLWLDYTGLSKEQAEGWGWIVAAHPDDLHGLTASLSLLASGEAGQCEARLRRFDGAYRWFLFRTVPVRDESANIVRWHGTNIDIEDRKRAEEALRQRELSLQLVVDSIPVPVAVTTPAGAVETLNRPALEYFGKTLEELG